MRGVAVAAGQRSVDGAFEIMLGMRREARGVVDINLARTSSKPTQPGGLSPDVASLLM